MSMKKAHFEQRLRLVGAPSMWGCSGSQPVQGHSRRETEVRPLQALPSTGEVDQ